MKRHHASLQHDVEFGRADEAGANGDVLDNQRLSTFQCGAVRSAALLCIPEVQKRRLETTVRHYGELLGRSVEKPHIALVCAGYRYSSFDDLRQRRRAALTHEGRRDFLQAGHGVQVSRQAILCCRQLLFGALTRGDVNHDGDRFFDFPLRLTNGRNMSVDPDFGMVFTPATRLDEKTLARLKKTAVKLGVRWPVVRMCHIADPHPQ